MIFRQIGIAQVADFNPSTPRISDGEEEVAFVPMAAVSETGTMSAVECKRASELNNGYSYFQSGDVLVAKITPCFENNKIAVAAIDQTHGFGSTEFHVIRPHTSVLDARYLAHFLRQDSVRDAGKRRMTGSAGQRRVPRQFLEELEIPLPPLDEQRRIVTILDHAVSLCWKRRDTLVLLDLLIESRLQSLLSGLEGSDKKFTLLGDICDVQGGLQLSRSRNDAPIEVPYLRVANVYRNRLWLDEIKHLKATAPEISRTALQHGDVLVVEGHGNANEIGRAAVWNGSIQPCVHQNHLIRVRAQSDTVDAQFICRYLNSSEGRKHLLSRGKTTSGLNTISVSDVKNTPILNVETSKQRDFSKFVGIVDNLGQAFLSHSSLLDDIFYSLQHRAFHGGL
jgi:type I restriction enzyme S subunit